MGFRDVQIYEAGTSTEAIEECKIPKGNDSPIALNRSLVGIVDRTCCCSEEDSISSVDVPSCLEIATAVERPEAPTVVAVDTAIASSVPRVFTKCGSHSKDEDFDNILAAGCAAALTWMALDAVESSSQTCFHSSVVPNLSLSVYLDRMRRYFDCSGSCFVLTLLYIDRLVKCNPQIRVTSLTEHRLSLVSLLIAVKFSDDQFYSNAYYAKVGGVTTKELNRLEKQFLLVLDWRLAVDESEYNMYQDMVFQAANVRHG